MSDETVNKNNEESAEVKKEAKAGENKEAEGQGFYHLKCSHCGASWYNSYWNSTCPRCGWASVRSL
ncbi:MAG: hypothetical protein IJQ73_03575 [Kiritimatiellae bacterium]|nr:hypothetical protein [Kiritimatiellia bacterium]